MYETSMIYRLKRDENILTGKFYSDALQV